MSLVDIVKEKKLDYYISHVKNNSSYLSNIYEIIRVPVFNYSLSIVKNYHVAEDILHEVMIKIPTANYESNKKPMAWIITITKNLCLEHLRKNKKISNIDDEVLINIKDEKKLDVSELTLLRSLLLTLDEKEREIVVMIAIIGFKNKEVAEFLNMPLSTILSKYNRAIKKMRNKIEEEI